MTLNQLALQFMTLGQTQSSLVIFGALLLGGLLGATIGKPKGIMARGSFFALSLLMHFGFKLLVFASRFVLPEIGISFGLVGQLGLIFVLLLLFGFFYGQIAVARGRDLYGRSIAAVIAFIPVIGWLWFIFGPSRDEPVGDYVKLPGLLKGGLAFLVGVACMVGVYFLGKEQRRITQPISDAVAEIEAEIETKGIENLEIEPDFGLYIRVGGLKMTLDSIAEAERSGIGEEGNPLLSASVEDDTLTFVMSLVDTVDPQSVDLEALNQSLVRDYCEDQLYRPIFEAGGTFTFDFRSEDEAPLTKVSINEEACAALDTP